MHDEQDERAKEVAKESAVGGTTSLYVCVYSLFVCMYVCMYVSMYSMHVCMYIFMYSMYVCMYVCRIHVLSHNKMLAMEVCVCFTFLNKDVCIM